MYMRGSSSPSGGGSTVRLLPAGVERRHRLDRRRERQRLAFFERDVPDIGGVDRLDAALLERLVHGARDEIVHHVVQDLIAVALPNQLGRHLSGTKP